MNVLLLMPPLHNEAKFSTGYYKSTILEMLQHNLNDGSINYHLLKVQFMIVTLSSVLKGFFLCFYFQAIGIIQPIFIFDNNYRF